MGLDMDVHVNIGTQEEPEFKEILYWRKQYSLQDWFGKLAIRKNLVRDLNGFNCIEVPLTVEDIQLLRNDLKNRNCPDFDYEENYNPGWIKRRLAECDEMLKYLYLGKETKYDSSW